jgi:hydrogenase maturation protease
VTGEGHRVLVAGIGNIFLSDDGFGVEVANRLSGRSVPDEVKVADFGIRGVHLAYELLDGYEALVLIDAMPIGETAGTVVVVEPDPDQFGPGDGEEDDAPALDAHSMNPAVVLRSLSRLGGSLDRVLVVGCQPATVEEGIGLSDPVAASVDGAVDLCLQLLEQLLQPAGKGTLR